MSTGHDGEEMLTTEDGFAAMFEFLKKYWSEFKTANLADVLGDMQPAYGGKSADSAAWSDWLQSVEKVLAKK